MFVLMTKNSAHDKGNCLKVRDDKAKLRHRGRGLPFPEGKMERETKNKRWRGKDNASNEKIHHPRPRFTLATKVLPGRKGGGKKRQ